MHYLGTQDNRCKLERVYLWIFVTVYMSWPQVWGTQPPMVLHSTRLQAI